MDSESPCGGFNDGSHYNSQRLAKMGDLDPRCTWMGQSLHYCLYGRSRALRRTLPATKPLRRDTWIQNLCLGRTVARFCLELGCYLNSPFQSFYSYAGLQNVNNVLNEVKNPVKTLKSVAPVALLTAIGLYLLVNVAYFMVIPIDEIKNSGELVAGLFFERVFGESFGRSVLPLAIAVSAVGNVMVVTFAYVCIPR